MLLNTDVRKAEVLLINEIKLLIKFGITILAIKTIKQINSISVAIIDRSEERRVGKECTG